MTTTAKTLTGTIGTTSSELTDAGGWIDVGSFGCRWRVYFRWADAQISPTVAAGTPVEFSIGEHRGRPVAVNVRKIGRGSNA